jgi:hypothetical protein
MRKKCEKRYFFIEEKSKRRFPASSVKAADFPPLFNPGEGFPRSIAITYPYPQSAPRKSGAHRVTGSCAAFPARV